MRNIKLTVEFDGTNYHGWQSQQNALSVSDILKNAIKELTGEDVRLTGCSRTDAGVHALRHISNFYTDSPIQDSRFAYAINCKLPTDIVVKDSVEVSVDFHSRFSAVAKKYRYNFYVDK